jgi:hypothetical protein
LHGVAVHVAKRARVWARKAAQSSPADLERVPALPAEADLDADHFRAGFAALEGCSPTGWHGEASRCP